MRLHSQLRARIPGAGFLLAMVAITLLATLLRLLFLEQKSYWFDEIFTVRICRLPLSAFWMSLWRFEANMVLYYAMLRPWIHFGQAESWVRLFSVLWGVASIPIMYLVGAQLYGKRRTGVIGGLLLCVNTAHVAYSQEARSYSLLILLCLLSLFFLLRTKQQGLTNTFAYSTVSALAVYTHFYAIFFLAAQWISVTVVCYGHLVTKKIIIMISLTTFLISPALYYMLFRRSGQLVGVPQVHSHDVVRLLYFLVADGGRFRKALSLLYLFCSGLAVYHLLRRWRSSQLQPQDWGLVIIVGCLLLPPLVTFVISFWLPLFFPRYLLICLAPFVLLASQGLTEFRKMRLRWGILGLTFGLSLGSVAYYYSRPKDDWRALTTYLLSHFQRGDVIVGDPQGAEVPVQYYSQVVQASNRTVLSYVSAALISRDMPNNAALRNDVPCGRVWLVVWGDNSRIKNAFQTVVPQYQQIDGREFPISLSVSLYSDSSLDSPFSAHLDARRCPSSVR